MNTPTQASSGAAQPGGPYFFVPSACRHVEESRRFILAAAEKAPAGDVAILGAGRCEEIPLAELVARFNRVVLNDVDAALLEQAIASTHFDDAQRAKLELHVGDLTAATDALLSRLDVILNDAANEDTAIDGMAQVLDEYPLPGTQLTGKFELIVASCVLSQLHFALVHRSNDLFEARFPGQTEHLRTSERWLRALDQVARRMERRFINDLVYLLAGGGLIYLADSVQMCNVKLTADGRWETAGTYRLLRTKTLADYLDTRIVIVAQGRWHWVVHPPRQPGDEGRLFDVQALVLGMRQA